MEYIKKLENYRNTEPGVITLGKFDGIHMGHRLLLDKMRYSPLKKLVFTFDQEKIADLSGKRFEVLTTSEERKILLERFRPDILLECAFTEEFRSMEPEKFVRDVLVRDLNIRQIIVGDDYTFGKMASGDAALLTALSDRYGYEVQVVPRILYEKEPISSSRIRAELVSGNMEPVIHMMGGPYPVIGTVTEGKKLGRTIGFPTANIILPDEKIMPPNGVYRSVVRVDGGEWMQAISNVGVRPTVEDHVKKNLETHIRDFSGDLYGKNIEVGLYEFIRPEMKFDNIDQLKAQITRDTLA